MTRVITISVVSTAAVLLFVLLLQPETGLAATTANRRQQSATATASGDKSHNKGKAVMNAAFANAGTRPGLQIWRIENFEPVPYPEKDFGKFYTGDSYIVLFTKERGGSYSWDIHFWLGAETSQDESGTAAVLTVQLDEQLGGVPIQYREVQEHESQLFLSHFKHGIRYLPGGVASGFNHVSSTVEKKLYQVKGKKNIRVKHVDLSVASLNKGDCFILDAGNSIYVYVGAKSKRVERLKAISAANQIRDQDHGGRSKVNVIDEFSTEDEVAEFFEALGSGSPSKVPEESAGGDDEQFEKSEERQVTLYKVSDATGKLIVEKVAEKPLRQNVLDTTDCYVLDTDGSDLFVWIGRKCDNREKTEAMTKAQHFLTSKHYPSWTHVQRIVEGGEPAIFRQYFSAWRGSGELSPRIIRSVSRNREVLHAYHCKMLRSHRLITHQIHDLEQEDLDEDDVVIVDSGSEIFVWFGKDAEEDERTLSLQKAELIKRREARAEPIITIEQGQEPGNFIELFPEWNPEHWNSIPSYENRKHAVLNN